MYKKINGFLLTDKNNLMRIVLISQIWKMNKKRISLFVVREDHRSGQLQHQSARKFSAFLWDSVLWSVQWETCTLFFLPLLPTDPLQNSGPSLNTAWKSWNYQIPKFFPALQFWDIMILCKINNDNHNNTEYGKSDAKRSSHCT